MSLRELAEKATPGPWAYVTHGDTGDCSVGFLESHGLCADGDLLSGRVDQHDNFILLEPIAPEVSRETNAAYIAAANPSAILALLDERDALRAALKGLSDMYGHAWDLVDGGLFMNESSTARFEKAHKAAFKLLEPK